MKFDTTLLVNNLADMPALAKAAEAMGFDGIWTSETANDAFMPLVLAAEHTQQLALGTAIAVAFPRTPAILAHIAWDLAKFSRGRFIMGLGTQVNGLLARGYRYHGKDYSTIRAQKLAESVTEWATDPTQPDRQVGWVTLEPEEYCCPVQQIAVRCRKKNGQWGVGVILFTLAAQTVLELSGQPLNHNHLHPYDASKLG